jgi:hypothetical protein
MPPALDPIDVMRDREKDRDNLRATKGPSMLAQARSPVAAMAAVTWAATSGPPIIVVRVLQPRPAGVGHSHTPLDDASRVFGGHARSASRRLEGAGHRRGITWTEAPFRGRGLRAPSTPYRCERPGRRYPSPGRRSTAPRPTRSRPRLMARCGSARPVAIQRREYPCGQLRVAAAVDQVEQRVEIDAAVIGELRCQVGAEARPEQPAPTPLDDLDRRRWLVWGAVEGHGPVSAYPVARLTSSARLRKTSELSDANRA